MNDIDTRLHDLGKHWRDAERKPPAIDPSIFVDANLPRLPRVRLLFRASAMVVGLVLGVAAVGLWTGLWRTASEAEIGSSALNPGDEVVAVGVVVAQRDGEPQVCDVLPVRLSDSSQQAKALCSAIAVTVQGLDLEGLPGWTERDDIGHSDLVAVRGTWTGRAIEGARAERASAGSESETLAPCETPNEGWPANPVNDLELEDALSRLGTMLSAEGGLFSGYWMAASAEETPTRIAVVGTVGDPGPALARLESIYPYPLCVIRVTYSAIDLERADDGISQALLTRPDGSWRARISQPLNRVVVRTSIVDDDLMHLMKLYPEGLTDPLVKQLP